MHSMEAIPQSSAETSMWYRSFTFYETENHPNKMCPYLYMIYINDEGKPSLGTSQNVIHSGL